MIGAFQKLREKPRTEKEVGLRFSAILGSAVIVLGIWILPCAIMLQAQEPRSNASADRLWDAARTGNVTAVAKELDAGVDVNAATAYHSTALCFASDRGHTDVVRLLLERGANPNVKDSFYGKTPLMGAQMGKHYDLITLLLQRGAEGSKQLLLDGIAQGDKPIVEAVLTAGTVDAETLASAMMQSTAIDRSDLVELLRNAKAPDREFARLTAEETASFVGRYSETRGSFSMEVKAGEKGLDIDFGSGLFRPWFAFGPTEFHRGSSRLVFEREDGKVVKVSMESNGSKYELAPSAPSEESTDSKPTKPMDAEEASTGSKQEVAPELAHVSSPSDLEVSSANWPGFRGTLSRGVADGQHPPLSWNIDDGESIAWKTAIPGFSNSAPVIWGDRLFVTTASSRDGNTDVKIGHYGDVDSVQDDSIYEFILYCMDKRTGQILWQRTCNTAKPAVKRHSKSSHANPTVATDGVHVIAWFGSEGLYAFDFEGRSLWSRDLGVLDSGWFFDPSYQWGFGSSPTIYGDRLFIQCDIQKGSFVAALDLATGEEVWRSERDEIPTWSSPIVASFGDLPMLITHGTRAARGYDARDGKLLWWLADHSEIVVPTPNVAHDLIYLASGYAPIQPIVAIRPEARGELKLPGRVPKEGGEAPSSDPGIAWSTQRGGPYMPTPIIYGDFLYACSNQGIVTCYRARTGEEVYKKRLKGGETFSFTASPIAADGHLYFTSESGHVYVVQAGGTFKQLHVNAVGSKVLATPAISEGILYVRTVDHVVALRGSRGDAPQSIHP
jgi:outer membrane protein assembly factor BamB